MKKILSILGTISLSTIISTNIIACKQTNNNNEKIKLQKPPNNNNGKLVNDFNGLKNNFDNKYYFVIGKHYNEEEGEIKKFKHDSKYDMRIENYIKNNSFKGLYRGDGINEPTIPTIDNNTGKITDGNKK